jgi:hypothetical protein
MANLLQVSRKPCAETIEYIPCVCSLGVNFPEVERGVRAHGLSLCLIAGKVYFRVSEKVG